MQRWKALTLYYDAAQVAFRRGAACTRRARKCVPRVIGWGGGGHFLNAPDAKRFEISQNGLQRLMQLLKGYILR